MWRRWSRWIEMRVSTTSACARGPKEQGRTRTGLSACSRWPAGALVSVRVCVCTCVFVLK